MASADHKITIRTEPDTVAVVLLPGVRVITIDPIDSVTVYRPQGASGE